MPILDSQLEIVDVPTDSNGISHIYCDCGGPDCGGVDIALCGKDISDMNFVDETPDNDQECVVCEDLDNHPPMSCWYLA